MKIILAPMEGVIDYALRELLGQIGGYDLVITEFLRVSNRLYPDHHFYGFCPELLNGGKTKSGMDVRIQILGQDAVLMGENAHKAIELGSQGVDINFGCPAKKVNKHRGGVILLDEPETVHHIVSTVRQSMPKGSVLSVKMRLGVEDADLAIINAQGIEDAGADMLTVHARTKTDGYKPPAHWHYLQDIRKAVKIPVIANGDVFCKKSAEACLKQSGCEDIMIGRGGLTIPNLGKVIRGTQEPTSWEEVKEILIRYAAFKRDEDRARYLPNRIKQWFTYLNGHYAEAEVLFKPLKKLQTLSEITDMIKRS